MKASSILFAAALGMALLSGCDPEDESATRASKGRLFGVSFQTMNNPFFVDLNEGIKEVVEAHGDRLVTLDAQFNSLKQKNDVSDMVLQRASGVFINPVNWKGIKGSLQQARRKDIPCIIVDAPAKDVELALATVASDNVEAGRMAARALAEVNPGAKIVILHLMSNKACIDRVTGFQEELAKHPDMEILAIQEGKGTKDGARPVMLDLLGRFPELDAAFPINDPSALGAVSALKSARKLGNVTIVTVDGSQDGIKAVRAGELLSTSAQFPKEIGRKSAEIMYAHLEGKTVEKDVKVRVELITKDNAESFLRAE